VRIIKVNFLKQDLGPLKALKQVGKDFDQELVGQEGNPQVVEVLADINH
jgi:hypothetical protein